MNIFSDIQRWIILNNPIDLRDIETSSSDVSTKQNALFHLTKFIECSRSFLLLLFSVDLEDIYIDVIEEIGVELDAVAGGKEYHYFLMLLFLFTEECQQQSEFISRVDHHKALLQSLNGCVFIHIVNSDI